MSELVPAPPPVVPLLEDVRRLILEAQRQTAVVVNMRLTLLYWQIGRRIRQEVLNSERAAYGEQILVTVSRQLSWSHFRELLPLTQPFQREFYAELARIEGWSVRTHRERIDSIFYERTTLSKQPEALIPRLINCVATWQTLFRHPPVTSNSSRS
jgi:hypothetical protein